MPLKVLFYLIIINILAIMFYGALLVYSDRLDSKKINLEQEIEISSKQLSLLQKQDILSLGGQIGNAKNLLDQHIFFSKFLKSLSAFMHPRVVISELNVRVSGSNEKSSIRMEAPDYRVIGEALKAVQNSGLFLEIKGKEVVPSQNANSYLVSFEGAINVEAIRQ